MSSNPQDLDPVTLSVIRGRVKRIANEMDLTLVNSAFSPIICEANDMASGIFRPDGRTISQGDYGLPIFVGNMEFSVASVVNHFEGDIKNGDVFVTNDPYLGGTHLMDVTVIQPFFEDGKLVAFIANTGHWTDIGSASPGGFTGQTTEIFQEGLRIPPIKVTESDGIGSSFEDLITSNVREPMDILGDYRAQLNALHVGEDRLQRLVDELGLSTFKEAIDELERRSEEEMRSNIQGIPDGTYRFTDYMDNDGVVDEPLRIELVMTIDGSDVLLDFTGSSPPCAGPMNIAKSCTISACNILFKHIYPEIPINAGCFAPLEFVIPEGTFLNASPPRPVAGYNETSQRVLDVALGAMSKALPKKVPAQSFSSSSGMSLASDRADGKEVMSFAVAGGYGGSLEYDGLSHSNPQHARARMPSVEVLEDRYSIRFRAKGLRQDSEGAGRRRGGLGTCYDIEVLSEDATYSVVGDRAVHTPNGVAGGQSGSGAKFTFISGDETTTPEFRTKVQDFPLSRGDLIRIESPGGGGYGPPTEREPERVRRDVQLGYISTIRAADAYGVAVEETEDGYQINHRRTEMLREEMDAE